MADRGALEASLEHHGVPKHLRQGLIDYVIHGQRPGGFLLACLENNFVDAVCRAIDLHVYEIVAVAKWIFNEAPSRCWGSPGIVKTWRGE